MKYLIIERFHPGKIKEVYQRFDQKGRLLPKGVMYLNSWVDEKMKTCYQVMESDTPEHLKQWIAQWEDLVDFEIIPLISSAEARQKVLGNRKDSITVRFAKPEDGVAVSAVLRAAFTEFEKDYTQKAFEATTITPEGAQARMQEGPIWVALLREEIMGTVSGLASGKAFYIRGMGVHPDARGKKLGLKLLQHLEKYARKEDFDQLKLSTTPYLKQAIQLYEKFGFKIVNLPPYDLFNTPLVTMVKDLK